MPFWIETYLLVFDQINKTLRCKKIKTMQNISCVYHMYFKALLIYNNLIFPKENHSE